MTKMQSKSLLNSAVLGGRKRLTPMCLFGAPDPLEVEKLYEEEVMKMQDTFARKWGLDLLTMTPDARLWVEVREARAEDRLSAEVVDVTPSPEGRRVPDADKEVHTVGSRRGEPVRYNPYHKQQKLTDYWRTTKSPC